MIDGILQILADRFRKMFSRRNKMENKAKWTFMVYMAGDNNLSSAGETDIGELAKIGSSEDVNIIVEFDRIGTSKHSKRYFIQKDDIQEIEDLGETDCGDPNTALDFIRWTADSYPADRYGLVLWNHGGGWEPSAIDTIATEVGTAEYGRAEGAERSASPLGRVFFRTSLRKIMSQESMDDRAICSDDGSGHSIDTIELGKVLEKATNVLGQPIDLLGMDACLMSNFEVAYQVRNQAHYIVASEENEPANGWPYNLVLEKLVTNPDIATAEFCAHIVDAYIQSYAHTNFTVTQSAFDLSQSAKLAQSLDKLAQSLKANMPAVRNDIWSSQFHAAKFMHNTLWDIRHFCQMLHQTTSNESVRNACQSVLIALTPGEGNFILAESHRGEKVKNCGGVTIYFTPPPNGISKFYGELDYAKSHFWDELLKEYHNL